jgi:hypothetical protein
MIITYIHTYIHTYIILPAIIYNGTQRLACQEQVALRVETGDGATVEGADALEKKGGREKTSTGC